MNRNCNIFLICNTVFRYWNHFITLQCLDFLLSLSDLASFLIAAINSDRRPLEYCMRITLPFHWKYKSSVSCRPCFAYLPTCKIAQFAASTASFSTCPICESMGRGKSSYSSHIYTGDSMPQFCPLFQCSRYCTTVTLRIFMLVNLSCIKSELNEIVDKIKHIVASQPITFPGSLYISSILQCSQVITHEHFLPFHFCGMGNQCMGWLKDGDLAFASCHNMLSQKHSILNLGLNLNFFPKYH